MGSKFGNLAILVDVELFSLFCMHNCKQLFLNN